MLATAACSLKYEVIVSFTKVDWKDSVVVPTHLHPDLRKKKAASLLARRHREAHTQGATSHATLLQVTINKSLGFCLSSNPKENIRVALLGCVCCVPSIIRQNTSFSFGQRRLFKKKKQTSKQTIFPF